MSARPPIVLFLLDQLRADALGAAGNAFARTPHLDALAASSVRFASCVTNAPLCRPARVTLATGLPVHAHGVSTNARLPDGRGLPSHVRALRDQAGYHAAVIGKTHLHTGRGHLADHLDRLIGWGYSSAVELPDPQQHWVQSAHSDWLAATTPRGATDKLLRWRRYVADYTWDAPPPDAPPWRLSAEDHLDSFCARAAADFVRSYAADRPLYLSVCFPGPHPPFDAPSAIEAAFDPDDPALSSPIPAPSRGPVPPLRARYASSQRRAPEDWTEHSARALRARYAAKVAHLDAAVGRVIEALREASLYDGAWILVTSDHGEMLADHGMTGKVLAYESSLRIPLLVRPPGGCAGRTDEGAVDLLDLAATLVELGGLDPAGMAGESLVARVLEGPGQKRRDETVLFEVMGQVGLRTGDLTFCWQLDLGRPVELFDRRTDPDQRWNRVDEPDERERIEQLTDALRRRRPLPVGSA